MGKHDSDATRQAKQILRGQDVDPEQLLKLVKKLKKENAFGYARKVLALGHTRSEVAQDSEFRLKFAEGTALCTYKDRDLPDARRLDDALKILSCVQDLQTTKNPGDAWPRRWHL